MNTNAIPGRVQAIVRRLRLPKVISRSRYDELLNAIAAVGRLYRKHSDGSDYHHAGTIAHIPLDELSTICCAENVVWKDIEPLIHGTANGANLPRSEAE